jgi:hypothetical protein
MIFHEHAADSQSGLIAVIKVSLVIVPGATAIVPLIIASLPSLIK